MTFMAESLHMTAQCIALGTVKYTATPYALKGQYVVENKYIEGVQKVESIVAQ